MPYTNRTELDRLFAHFCLFWAEGLHATVQMLTTGDGKVRAQLEFELGKPGDIFPVKLSKKIHFFYFLERFEK